MMDLDVHIIIVEKARMNRKLLVTLTEPKQSRIVSQNVRIALHVVALNGVTKGKLTNADGGDMISAEVLDNKIITTLHE